MPWTAAHSAALGLQYWRRRGAQRAAAASPEARGSASMPPPLPPAPSEPLASAAAYDPEAGTLDDAAAIAARVAGMDWAMLRRYLAELPVRQPARQAVFGVGAEQGDLFVVGEAPGAEEDRIGEPFVGPAGHLLDKMLAAIGCSRHRDTFIGNICKFRPPNNRDPRPDEIAADLPVLQRQIALVQPRALLAVGRVAAQTLLGSPQPIGRLRGRAHEWDGIPLVVTYHPAYLLRSPREKAKAWQDLKRLQGLLRA